MRVGGGRRVDSGIVAPHSPDLQRTQTVVLLHTQPPPLSACIQAAGRPGGLYNMHGDRSFSAASPRLWNDLPPGLRRPGLTLDSFRQSLKTHLFGDRSA